MMLNSEKCHYMCIRKNCADDTFLHNDKKFKNSKEKTILGVIIDNKLTFDSHINKIFNKAGQKLSEPSRISAFIDLNKRQILYQSMIKSQFSYCPLISLFCSRKSNSLQKIKNWKFETCPVVYAKLFKNILVLSNFNYLFVCLFICFFVYLFFFVVCFFCLESLFILFYCIFYTACFIVVATFLQFPIL